MTAPDAVRWRGGAALSKLSVESRISVFYENPYAPADYYDLLLVNSLGNYRTLLDQITYYPENGSLLHIP